MSPTKPGRRMAARQRAERQWLAWLDLRRYQTPPANRFLWGQQLGARSLLLQGRWPGPMPWDVLREDPLQVGFMYPQIPTALVVRDVAWKDVECLHAVYQAPGLAAVVSAWESEHGRRCTGDFVLIPVFTGRHVAPRGPELHPFLIETMAENISEAAYRRLFELAQGAALVVDLSATNARLIAGFKEWLRERRAQMRTLGVDGPERVDRRPKKRRKMHGTPEELQKWHQARVLPYLDIRLLAGAEGRPMPSGEIVAEVLFPKHGAEAVAFLNDHTLPLVGLLSQPHVVDGLVADGAAQKLQAEKSP